MKEWNSADQQQPIWIYHAQRVLRIYALMTEFGTRIIVMPPLFLLFLSLFSFFLLLPPHSYHLIRFEAEALKYNNPARFTLFGYSFQSFSSPLDLALESHYVFLLVSLVSMLNEKMMELNKFSINLNICHKIYDFLFQNNCNRFDSFSSIFHDFKQTTCRIRESGIEFIFNCNCPVVWVLDLTSFSTVSRLEISLGQLLT